MMKKCSVQEDPYVAFFLNCLVHAFILFTILSVFFIVYISRLEEKTFRKEIGSLLGQQIQQALDSLSPQDTRSFQSALENFDLEKLQAMYTGPDPTVKNNNKWLLSLTYTIIGVVIGFVVILSLVLYFSCRMCVHFKDILVENVVIFVIVGAVEICFFLFIASQYSPVKPSTMTTTLIQSLQKKLS